MIAKAAKAAPNNAMEPGSYVMPHRHLDANKDETFVVLRGTFGLLLFDDAGQVTQALLLRAGGTTLGANVPHGTWHSLLAFEPGSAFLEAKGGPYVPLGPDERAPWAPAEGDPGVAAYVTNRTLWVGRYSASLRGSERSVMGNSVGEGARGSPGRATIITPTLIDVNVNRDRRRRALPVGPNRG